MMQIKVINSFQTTIDAQNESINENKVFLRIKNKPLLCPKLR
jgi:hypothetical protein